MKILDLFAGIGGFSLGMHWAGFETAAFCEKDQAARKVLKKRFPGIPIYESIEVLTYERLTRDGIIFDVVTGGFPCQDISVAGKKEGINGKRSGLWSHMYRLIKDSRPKWAIIENVSALRSKGLALVLQNLDEIGYVAEWHCIPASSVGASHRRDRIWIIARPMVDADSPQRQGTWLPGRVSKEFTQSNNPSDPRNAAQTMGDSTSERQPGPRQPKHTSYPKAVMAGETAQSIHDGQCSLWGPEPLMGRVADGVPNRVDRLTQLGNAVVPQIPYLIGKSILEWESDHVLS